MLVTFAAMAIIKKLDLASPVVIKNARIAFVAYHVSIQVSVLILETACWGQALTQLSQVLVAYVQWKCGNELKTQKPWKGETVVVEVSILSYERVTFMCVCAERVGICSNTHFNLLHRVHGRKCFLPLFRLKGPMPRT